MAGRLTKRVVDAATPRTTTFVLYDSELPGFGLRVTPTGATSYVVEYRPGAGGRGVAKRRLTLGSAATLTPDEARRLARERLASVRLGADPAGERARQRETPTLAQVIERYLAEEVEPKRKPGTAALYAHYLRGLTVPKLGTRKIDALSRADVARLHREIGADRPVTANRVLAALSGLFTFAKAAGLVDEAAPNPARGVAKFREEARERYLSGAELARLGEAIREAETVGVPWEPDPARKVKHAPKPERRRAKVSPFAAAALRLLMFTGARLREILHLRWQDVDLERGLLFLPDSKTGRKTIVLGAPALAVLADLPRAGAYVIAGDVPTKPRRDLKRPWALVSRRAGLAGVRLHDLRHSFASVGAGASLGLPMIGKLLGHAQASTTQRYAHLDADPLKRAADMIGGRIAEAMGEVRPRADGPENKSNSPGGVVSFMRAADRR